MDTATNLNIRTHKELAEHIQGKRILHLNSMGKDSAVCLEWLAHYAQPAHIVALHFRFMAKNPDDDLYLTWQKKRYPMVEFIDEPNPHELNNVQRGTYQRPEDILQCYNSFEYHNFTFLDHARCVLKTHNMDYICRGHSKYESVTRASIFYRRGLVQDDVIYPIGMMNKQQILDVIKNTGIKLHPVYKYAKSSMDAPSYYKLKNAMIVNPEYRKNILKVFPLLLLDEYRYEVLLNEKK